MWMQHYGAASVFYVKNVTDVLGNPTGEVIIFETIGWKAIEIQNSYGYDGAKIQVWDYSTAHHLSTQRWRIEANPYASGAVNIVNVNSEKVFDAMGSAMVPQVKIHAWPKVDVPSQRFVLNKLNP